MLHVIRQCDLRNAVCAPAHPIGDADQEETSLPEDSIDDETESEEDVTDPIEVEDPELAEEIESLEDEFDRFNEETAQPSSEEIE